MGLLAPWLALLPFLTLCRTAFFDSTSLERRSSVGGSLATFVVSQTNKSLVANPAQNQTADNDLEEFEYNIPNSSRFVSIIIDKSEALDHNCFRGVITTALYQLQRHIALHGDSPLWPRDIPYTVLRGGCNSTTDAFCKLDGTPWLTYKILQETFIGLKATLSDERRCFLTAYSISDLNRRMYGQGTII